MQTDELAQTVGRRFHSPRAPTILARARPSRTPIVVSHVVSDIPTPDRTLAPPVETAFAIHVHHRPLLSAETWIDGAHARLPPIAPGGICIFDLRSSPVALIREPFEFSRFYMSRATLDDLAYHQGVARVESLRTPVFGQVDPVIHHLALALIMRQRIFGEEADSLFADWVALAFHSHVVSAYGGARKAKQWRGGLPPTRLRRVCELMTEKLADPLSIAQIAEQIDMTAGHFARAFREATGEPPHRWLMRKRIERAKELLRSQEITLAEIAAVCGFVDQSHFTRVFGRAEGVTPSRWREDVRR